MTGAPLPPELIRAHASFRGWLFDRALPFWNTNGRDAEGLGFHEHLTLDGSPADVPYKRIRVQARQVYAFSHAALLGWNGGLRAARHGYEFLSRHARQRQGGWASVLDRRGGVLDATADLYDLAFVVFALAWYGRASGDAEPLAQARATLDWIRGTMRAPAGGFHNAWPVRPGPRQQNPHMHLLEAVLALQETAPHPDTVELAHELVGLFRTRFLEAGSGTLGEFFTDDLRPAPGDMGDHVEPGHHFEWVWLLHEHARLTGQRSDPEAAALYRFARTHGVDPTGTVIFDVVARSGAVRVPSSRLWPHTEAIKAHVAMLRRGEPAGPDIAGHVAALLDRHFTHCPPGAWREHFDAAGASFVDRIPASSFYHVMMAYGELDRLVSERSRSGTSP